MFFCSIKYLTILKDLSVESSQLDLYFALFTGTLSVFPSATISLSVSCIIFAIVSRTCILLSFISAFPESNSIDSSTSSTIPLSSSLILISSVREFCSIISFSFAAKSSYLVPSSISTFKSSIL